MTSRAEAPDAVAGSRMSFLSHCPQVSVPPAFGVPAAGLAALAGALVGGAPEAVCPAPDGGAAGAAPAGAVVAAGPPAALGVDDVPGAQAAARAPIAMP